MNNRRLCFLSLSIFVLSCTGIAANAQTAEQAERVLAALAAEDCEIVRDAMGEKMLSVDGATFVAEASCSDGKLYTITLDESFNITGRKAGDT